MSSAIHKAREKKSTDRRYIIPKIESEALHNHRRLPAVWKVIICLAYVPPVPTSNHVVAEGDTTREIEMLEFFQYNWGYISQWVLIFGCLITRVVLFGDLIMRL